MSRAVLRGRVGGPDISTVTGTCILPPEGTFLMFLTHNGGTTWAPPARYSWTISCYFSFHPGNRGCEVEGFAPNHYLLLTGTARR